MLQPRFQLIGEAMQRAADCEQLAAIGTVNASPDVLAVIEESLGAQERGQRDESGGGVGRRGTGLVRSADDRSNGIAADGWLRLRTLSH